MTVALVLGGASCVWDDVQAAMDLGEFDAVVACNDVGAAWPGHIDAWVSLHADKFKFWAARRDKAGFAPASDIFAHAGQGTRLQRVTRTTGFRFPGQESTGSSGLFALKVALADLGHDKAVLCGIPLSPERAHFFDERTWNAANAYKQGWKEALPQIANRARSMSGWTSDLLGRPDEGWMGA